MQLSLKERIRLKKNYGNWAIVTGASSGIGLELSTLLASAGLNLIIVSRHLDKLKDLETRLAATFHIEIKSVAADVSVPDDIDKIIEASKGLDAGLLIVSAGYGTSGLFIDSSQHAEMNMLQVNCSALLILTHYFSRYFVKQQRGGIILMSSMVAFQGVPYSANYAATKAYVQTLAEALAVELKSHHVDVLAAAPGPVKSGFEHRADMQMSMYLHPAQVGVPILKALGRKTTVFPGMLTKVLVYSLRMLPRWGKIKIMEKVMHGMTKHQNR